MYWLALVCTFTDTEAATEVTVDGFRQSFNFYNETCTEIQCLVLTPHPSYKFLFGLWRVHDPTCASLHGWSRVKIKFFTITYASPCGVLLLDPCLYVGIYKTILFNWELMGGASLVPSPPQKKGGLGTLVYRTCSAGMHCDCVVT